MGKTLIVVIVGIIFSAQGLTTPNNSIHLLASGGVKGAIEKIHPECERTVGNRLIIEYSSTAVLKQKIEAGEPFDVVIGTVDGVDDLSKKGMLTGSHPVISRVGTGIGARAGVPRPDISTPDSLKRALLDAKSVTYGSAGASAAIIMSMFDRLGITDRMKAKAYPLPGADLITGSVVAGKNQYVITLVSEILPIKGLELVGPLPAPFQRYTYFAVGVSARPQNSDAAAIARCFVGPQAASAYKAVGMEPITRRL